MKAFLELKSVLIWSMASAQTSSFTRAYHLLQSRTEDKCSTAFYLAEYAGGRKLHHNFFTKRVVSRQWADKRLGEEQRKRPNKNPNPLNPPGPSRLLPPTASEQWETLGNVIFVYPPMPNSWQEAWEEVQGVWKDDSCRVQLREGKINKPKPQNCSGTWFSKSSVLKNCYGV